MTDGAGFWVPSEYGRGAGGGLITPRDGRVEGVVAGGGGGGGRTGAEVLDGGGIGGGLGVGVRVRGAIISSLVGGHD